MNKKECEENFYKGDTIKCEGIIGFLFGYLCMGENVWIQIEWKKRIIQLHFVSMHTTRLVLVEKIQIH